MHNLIFVTRLDDDSSDEDVLLSELAVRGGKSTSHSSSDDEEDKESECIGKKSNDNSGCVGVLSVVGGHLG